MLEVRELFEIILDVDLTNDPNASTRTITIANGTENANRQDITIAQSAGSVESVRLYTYLGLNTKVLTTCDSVRYSGVEFDLNGVSLTESGVKNNIGILNAEYNFETDGDMYLVVAFVAKQLEVEYSYYLNDQEKHLNDVIAYIQESAKPQTLAPYKVGDSLTYTVNILNDNYNLKVLFNNMAIGETDNQNRIVTNELSPYVLSDNDYNYGGVNIKIYIYEKDTSRINVQYKMENSSKIMSADVYGTLEVYQGDELSSNGVIMDGKRVYIKCNLETGYKFTGRVQFASLDPVNASVGADGRVVLIDSFNPDYNSGNWYILIDKIPVVAELTQPTDGLAKYYINGSLNKLEGLYVGKTISFANTNVVGERLGCFYYETLAGNVYLTDNGLETGAPLTSVVITSDMLEAIGGYTIKFGVVAIKRYKLSLTVIGSQYLLNLRTTHNGSGNTYTLGLDIVTLERKLEFK